jgi:hypothetical protein
MRNLWDGPLKVDGLEIMDGDRVGVLFYTGRLMYAKYNAEKDSLIFEEDNWVSPMCDDHIWGIRRWLQSP